MRNMWNLLKRYSHTSGASKVAGVSPPSTTNVKGLTTNCVKSVSEPVGPGASTNGYYKVPEYFCYNRFSYAEAEIEMAKYRCSQPSALKK